MTLPRTLPLLLAALLPLTGIAQNQSCTDTQAEVQRLREQVRTLQAALDAKADAATVPASATLPGTAAKPAPQVRVVVEEPYSHTGCSRGLLKGIAPAQWQDGELWKDLRNGQTPAEVEALLGPDGASEQALETYARSKTPGILQSGRDKVIAGHTTLREVLRVTIED